MPAVDLSTAPSRLSWAIGPAAESPPDPRDIRLVLDELTAARAEVAALRAELDELRSRAWADD
jgi:hypothetical protein